MTRNSLITRHGILNLKGNQTINQCAKQGHEVYYYELKVLFVSHTKLNQHGWIIDHQILDDTVQKVQVNSCEIMSKDILDAIEDTLKLHRLKCVGIKLKIKPAFVVKENSAYFQEYRCRTKADMAIVMNL